MSSTYCALNESAVEIHCIMHNPQIYGKINFQKTFEFFLVLTS